MNEFEVYAKGLRYQEKISRLRSVGKDFSLTLEMTKFGFEKKKFGFEKKKFGFEMTKLGLEMTKLGLEMTKFGLEMTVFRFEVKTPSSGMTRSLVQSGQGIHLWKRFIESLQARLIQRQR